MSHVTIDLPTGRQACLPAGRSTDADIEKHKCLSLLSKLKQNGK
jgi:hypothetical protein